MDLDPEEVKAELAAVKVACDEVSARLDSHRGRPGYRLNILSRISKASEPQKPAENLKPVASFAEYDRRSSRRFVNRDWQIARKRTAAGLFVDDQEGEADVENSTVGGHGEPPLKRAQANRHGSDIQHSELEPSEDSKALQAQLHKDRSARSLQQPGQQLYNPFESAKLARGSAPFANRQQLSARTVENRDDGTAQRRGFDPSRITKASAKGGWGDRSRSGQFPQQRPHDSEPDSRPQQGRGYSSHRNWNSITAAQAGSQGHGMKPEEGEVIAEEPPPGPPAEIFVAEKRPERTQMPEKVLKRNKRMFGALLGHLDGAERQEKKFEGSVVSQRRKELEQHASERARIQGQKAREAERQRMFEARRKDIATKRELLLQQHMKQAKLLCAEKIAYARSLLKFIRTETVPPILWEPASMNKDLDQLYEQQEKDFEVWAEEQTAKLRLEQQAMRTRAEKQWAELDRARELRHKETLGRGQSSADAVRSVPKVVKSSVMTAREVRARAEVQQDERDRIAAPAVQNTGENEDVDAHAEDEAEANDEGYLLLDEDKAQNEAQNNDGDAGPERLSDADVPATRGPDTEGAGNDDEADSQGEEKQAVGAGRENNVGRMGAKQSMDRDSDSDSLSLSGDSDT